MEEQTIANKIEDPIRKAQGRDIILFDGVCNLCNSAVNFILDHDPKGVYAFASLQSTAGREILAHYGLSTEDLDSVVLIKEGKVYKKSRAALEISSKLKGGWSFLQVFKVVPRVIGDGVYNFIAKNRYRFFGRRESCRFPTPDIRSRFLEGL